MSSAIGLLFAASTSARTVWHQSQLTWDVRSSVLSFTVRHVLVAVFAYDETGFGSIFNVAFFVSCLGSS